MPKPFLTAKWKHLILANYKCDPAILTPHLPAQTELDLWQGDCLISLVGFRFLDTRVKGIKIPFHVDFEEVNLRFYVKHKHEGEWRRGVVFVREIVPKAAITTVANLVYKEHYVTCPTSHRIERAADNFHVSYQWRYKGQEYELAVDTQQEAKPMAIGSEEEFIAEHYWGYTKLYETRSSQYEVRHPKWDVYGVDHFAATGDFGFLYGEEFRAVFEGTPTSVFLAEGSEIEVYPGAPIR